MILPSSPSTPTPSPLVLVVDDVEDNLDAYGQFLVFKGYRVELVSTGEDALRQAVSLQPDVIVMDLGLPRLDGWEATRQLKQQDRTRLIPVIAVSGHVVPELQKRALEAGCIAFLAKPCDPARLVEEIEIVLGPAAVPKVASSAPGTVREGETP